VAAAALSLGLFTYWGVLGLALLSLLYTDRRTGQRLLLAPAIGIVVVLLPVFWLNRLGLPVGRFGLPLTIVLLGASGAVLAWRRPLVAARHSAPFAAILLAAGILTGRPFLTFGFDWLSVANDDMANYCLLAQRLLTRGFFEPPSLDAVRTGLDYSGYYFWTYHLTGTRPGPETLLAWLASVTRLNSHQAFMPLIVAAHLALIGAVTALVYQTRRDRPAAIVACALLAVGALVSLGALYQLLAQVLGLSLLAAFLALLLQPTWSARPIRLLGLGVLTGLVGAGLVLVYTEIVPFAAVAAGGSLAVAVARRHRSVRSLLWVLVPAGLVAASALGSHALAAARFLPQPARQALRPLQEVGSESLFPYMFLPSGLAQATGFQPLTLVLTEPWLSFSVALGAAFLLLTAVTTTRLLRRSDPIAFMAATMMAVGVGLFTVRAAFGLFKLAMFFQPFMLGILAVGWLRLGRRSRWWTGALVGLAVGNLAVQASYVQQSHGVGSMAEVREVSGLRVPAAFSRALREAAPRRLDLDTANVVLAKLQALHFDSTPATFLTRDFFYEDIDFYGATSSAQHYRERIPGEWQSGIAPFAEAITGRRAILQFPLADGSANAFSSPRPGTTAERTAGGALALTTGGLSVFNRRHLGRGPAAILIQRYAEVSNHLVFLASRFGQHYYRFVDRRRVALYQLEADPLYPGRTMAAVGRHLLFRVVNPGPTVRLVLDVSTSFKGEGGHDLPPVVVLGATRVPMALVGSGSARVVSAPLTTREIEGVRYLAIDMGMDGKLIPIPRTGLMRAYGTHVPIDGRTIVAFVRDVSLVSSDEYEAQEPPSALTRFPADLAMPALEYSGIYEDGWIAGQAYLRLARPPGRSRIVIKGMRPPDDAASPVPTAVVLVDGHEAARQAITTPEFAITAGLEPGSGRMRIDVVVSPLRALSAPDTRRVGFLLRSVAFEP
jgi:hypothetical protein